MSVFTATPFREEKEDSNGNLGRKGDGAVLPRYEAVIFDETHQQAATQYVRSEISFFRFEKQVLDLYCEVAAGNKDDSLIWKADVLLEERKRFIGFLTDRER
jgi:hypothetical protein